jgi:hypothetical protein
MQLMMSPRSIALDSPDLYYNPSTERNINAKVTQMAAAHTAIRNFAVGSAVIAIVGFIALRLQNPGNAVAPAIRKDASLQQLLRGPQGPQGPAVGIELPKVISPCDGLKLRRNDSRRETPPH